MSPIRTRDEILVVLNRVEHRVNTALSIQSGPAAVVLLWPIINYAINLFQYEQNRINVTVLTMAWEEALRCTIVDPPSLSRVEIDDLRHRARYVSLILSNM